MFTARICFDVSPVKVPDTFIYIAPLRERLIRGAPGITVYKRFRNRGKEIISGTTFSWPISASGIQSQQDPLATTLFQESLSLAPSVGIHIHKRP